MFGIPISYPIIVGVLGLVLLYTKRQRALPLKGRLAELGLWRWVVLGWLTLIVALVMAILQQSEDPFVDWRNWAVIALATVVLARFLEDAPFRRFVLSDLAVAYGVIATIHLVLWAGGGGSNVYDVRVPLFNGYDLSLSIFASLVASATWLEQLPEHRGIYRHLLAGTAIASSGLVVLSFRRSWWGFLFVGLAIVGWDAARRRKIGLGLALRLTLMTGIVVLAAVAMLGTENVGERLASFNPVSDNQYSSTNVDHVNDLIDAMRVIRRGPLLGLGIGRTYETNLIANWKPESFEVHNAFLNVWLKFGLVGLVAFVGFHLACTRALWRAGHLGAPSLIGAGTALLAEQIVGLVQPWVYASLQYSLHRAVVLAVLVTYGWTLTHERVDSTERQPLLVPLR